MPAGPDHIPNARERGVLQQLRSCEWEYDAKLYPAGQGTIDRLIAKGWIKRLPSTPSKRCTITAEGKAAMMLFIPMKPASPKSKTLRP
jgi:hypothetical protein